ncbi:aspartate aminotransferase family protein [Actinopolyspora erythraea]|uniref:Acetylornithine aminotransferase n=1 Tax=Actinopolyspora erythraea TaxID=414996 RepID=A0A099D7E5_9ACTN|nr:acetylornithine transaminase [Actinopolyspora erythraea]ASU78543.1 aspartate aminotransferase family protein [Actinopolyspora erythraea]KGI82018.1 acetylornithine aminotransferase [Actinopolyspora erythraea]
MSSEEQGNAAAARRWREVIMPTYGTPSVELVSGSGCTVTDAEGNTYLDLLGGIAVAALGHAHPAVASAVSEQIAKLGHVSNFYSHEPGLRLAERLLQLAGVNGDGRVFFCNSGSEANEAAFKIARRTGRPNVVAADRGFHGRTMGSLALTGQPEKQTPFEPLPAGVSHVPFGDTAALDEAVDENTAAIVLEPVQGEAGVIVPPEGYLQSAREIADRNGALLILDEVQTGIGRTGYWFAFQRCGIVPDVITLAKGLGGGLPLGACIGVGRAAFLLEAGQHATTFGGNPVCCAAALAVLHTIESEGLLEHACRVGKEIIAAVDRLGHPAVKEVRGLGMLLAVELDGDIAAAAAESARERGYLINPVRPDTLRLAPPLILDEQRANEFVRDLAEVLSEAHGGEGKN